MRVAYSTMRALSCWTLAIRYPFQAFLRAPHTCPVVKSAMLFLTSGMKGAFKDISCAESRLVDIVIKALHIMILGPDDDTGPRPAA